MNEVIGDDWCAHHFDHLAPQFNDHFNETLDHMRERYPVARSDRYGGFWVVTRYDQVLEVLQDWRTFSSADKVSIPYPPSTVAVIPQEVDPPLHREFRRLLNVFLTPTAVAPYEGPTRTLINRLIDSFIGHGRCEFMSAFAEQLPRISFFDLVMHAPSADVERLSEMTRIADGPQSDPRRPEAWGHIDGWIRRFVAQRRDEPGPGDIVAAVLNAEVDGRPITDDEIIGAIELLLFGGFGTTASALGHAMIRFATEPDLSNHLRHHPEAIPTAVEELLRIDAPVVSLARTATRDAVLGGQEISAGEKVLFSLASANRDNAQFPGAASLNLDRPTNRHLSFGAGPHRCAGSNLARLNLRLAVEELTCRLRDIRLDGGPNAVEYRTSFSRTPTYLPILFTPGEKALPARPPVGPTPGT